MRFRRQMQHHVGLMQLENALHRHAIADVDLAETVARILSQSATDARLAA